jgi:hypothetical protein
MSIVKKFSVVTMVFLLLLTFSSNLRAATFTINTTDDTNDVALGGGICADSNGNCSLRAAIQQANYDAGTDIIEVDAALPTPVVLTLTAGFSLIITDSLTFTGPGADQLTIDANSNSGVFYFNTLSGNGTLELSGMTITNGLSILGAGIYIDVGETLNLSDCLISNNVAQASDGGGLIAMANATVNITGSTFSGNVANDNGGAIALFDTALFVANNMTIGGNSAVMLGGGLFAESVNAVNITNSTFSGNHADADGGAINLSGTVGTSFDATNVTISGNTANGYGAGLRAGASSAIATLNNVTITNNTTTSAGDAAGIYMDANANIYLKNSIVSDNYANGELLNCYYTPPTVNLITAGNNISDDSTCNLGVGGDLPDTDPLLAALADNGGPTQTHRLITGSFAIDAITGNCTDQVAPTPNDILKDQRGFVRPYIRVTLMMLPVMLSMMTVMVLPTMTMSRGELAAVLVHVMLVDGELALMEPRLMTARRGRRLQMMPHVMISMMTVVMGRMKTMLRRLPLVVFQIPHVTPKGSWNVNSAECYLIRV